MILEIQKPIYDVQLSFLQEDDRNAINTLGVQTKQFFLNCLNGTIVNINNYENQIAYINSYCNRNINNFYIPDFIEASSIITCNTAKERTLHSDSLDQKLITKMLRTELLKINVDISTKYDEDRFLEMISGLISNAIMLLAINQGIRW